MLYLVFAKDGTDKDAPARRQAVRAEHLAKIRPAVESGQVQLGGALLDEQGGMIGSVMLIQAESETEVRALLERDVYTTGGVWQQVEVYPYKHAVGRADELLSS